MREFLWGKRSDLNNIENHIFFFDDIRELSVGARNIADLKPHTTIHRGISSYTFCNEQEKTYVTLTNMLGIMLITIYHKGTREIWENTQIVNGIGRIEAQDQHIQSIVGNELLEMLKTVEKASKSMSDVQQKKIEEKMKKVGADIKSYSVYEDWKKDLELKGANLGEDT